MYEERYDNHFLNIRASRDVVADFARFTVEAVQAPGTDALLTALLPALQTAAAAFGADLSGRVTSKGQSQTGTQTEEKAATAFTELVQATNKKLLQPRFYDKPTEQVTFYPDKLSGLTQAPKNARLTRYTAYTKALERHEDAAIQAAGAQARLLLNAYITAAATKNKSTKALQDTITSLTPGFEALAGALWAIHCAALYVHRQEPARARTYFAYDKLPSRKAPRKASSPPSNVP